MAEEADCEMVCQASPATALSSPPAASMRFISSRTSTSPLPSSTRVKRLRNARRSLYMTVAERTTEKEAERSGCNTAGRRCTAGLC
jgi:hypothetical protein